MPNLINQKAFNEGFQSMMIRHGLVKDASIDSAIGEYSDAAKAGLASLWKTITQPAREAGGNFLEGMKDPAIAAGVTVPTLAAIWYWHNKRLAEREAQHKTASLSKAAKDPVPPEVPSEVPPKGGFWGDLGGVAGAAAVGLPIMGIIGAYQLAEYMKNKQESLPQPDLDTILNINSQGGVVPTQQEKRRV